MSLIPPTVLAQLCLQMHSISHKHSHFLSPPLLPYSSIFTHMAMALSTNHLLLLLLLTFTLIFLSSLITPFSVEASSRDEEELRKMVLGSRPPACVNKCMSCRPCEATLVIPPHQRRINKQANNFFQDSSRREHDSYYLLSWKCRCGNKFYQP